MSTRTFPPGPRARGALALLTLLLTFASAGRAADEVAEPPTPVAPAPPVAPAGAAPALAPTEAAPTAESDEAAPTVEPREPAPTAEPDEAAPTVKPGEPASTAEPAPSAEPAAPGEAGRLQGPVAGQTPRWPDADDDAKQTAEGAIKVCEAVTFPLTLIPGVGSVISTVVEWGCLVPAAFAVDYVGVHHGNRTGGVWQALFGLVAAKLARSAILYPAIAGAVVVGVFYGTVVTAALLAANAAYYIPVGVTGLLTLTGVMAIGIHQLRKATDRLTFGCIYFGLTPEVESEAERQRVQQEAWLKPPLDPFSRAYALMTVAAVADVEGHWTYAIPVAGPLFKAGPRAAALKADMRRAGRDVFGEVPQDPTGMDATVDFVITSEAWLEAGSHALLIGGGVLFASGTLSAALAYQATGDVKLYAALAGGLGVTGIFVAGGGLVLLGLREVPRVLRPLAVPMAFGFLPPEEIDAE